MDLSITAALIGQRLALSSPGVHTNPDILLGKATEEFKAGVFLKHS